MGDRIIHLVRHGQYFNDEQSPRYGHLTQLGKRQAARTGRRLSQWPMAAIYYSDMPRAVETAEIIAQYLPKVPLGCTRLLREVCPPLPRSMPRSRNIPKELSWKLGRIQVDAACKRLLVPARGREKRHEVFVTHGNFIRYLIRRLLHDAPMNWVYYGTTQCGISTLVIRPKPSKPCLLCYNDVGHLPKAMQTGI